MKSENRYDMAAPHRAALKIANQGTPSNTIRITRYCAGQIVEIIEQTVEQARRTQKTLFTRNGAKAKPARAEQPDELSGYVAADMDAGAVEQFGEWLKDDALKGDR